jgi:DnaJ family protein C protein 17
MADDLTKRALAAAKGGHDLYALVGNAPADASIEDIRRAWRRANLTLHPDKAGADFDPELYERFSQALKILENEAARAAYDNAVAAVQAQQRRHAEMDADRRRMVEDLLAREKAAAAAAAAAAAGAGGGGGGVTGAGDARRARDETAEERRRREMREMKEHDNRRLEEERARLQKEEEEAQARMRREDDEQARRKEEEVKRRLIAKRRRREEREQGHARRVARDGFPISGPEAWARTRNMLVQEQRLRESRAAAGG